MIVIELYYSLYLVNDETIIKSLEIFELFYNLL